MKKNKAAQASAQLRHAKMTKDERSASARKAGLASGQKRKKKPRP
jgi:hypothetical protein